MFVVFKKKTLIASILLVFAVTIPICAVCAVNFGNALDDGRICIAIDAGHGGVDGGVTGSSGVKESDLNLAVARLLEGYLKDAGYRVVMTRKTSDSLYKLKQQFKRNDMKERIRIVEKAKAKYLISVHMNFFPANYRRGIQVFFGKEDSKPFADFVQGVINSEMNYSELNRNFAALYGDYYIIKNLGIPAIIAECGFLSSKADEKLLLSEEYRMLLAYNLYKGVDGYIKSVSP